MGDFLFSLVINGSKFTELGCLSRSFPFQNNSSLTNTNLNTLVPKFSSYTGPWNRKFSSMLIKASIFSMKYKNLTG